MHCPNVRLYNRFGESVRFFVDADDTAKFERIRKELAEYQELEPWADWKLATLGS